MKNSGESWKYFATVIVALILLSLSIYTICYREIYDSISISTVKTPIVEYGSANYDIDKLIKNVDGTIVSVKQDIVTDSVGVQELILVVSKGNISKEIPVSIEVKDSIGPEIVIENDIIEIEQGTNYDILSNITNVYDNIDGDISYIDSNSVSDDSCNYYTYYSDFNYNVPGEYVVNINAVDKNLNSTSKSFKIVVNKRSVGETVSSIAYSLVGSPYIMGANGPYGFDCSGFVQYVYSRLGIYISRSSSTQLYDGVAVSYSDILPGDIINWGYSNGVSTHSALYVGNGKMIHAANPSMGVIVSDVGYWLSASGTQIIGVRRIN
ncbi:nlpC/P60 family protein [Mycoplasma sp. CAG:877]|nr:nlpC/P60 family protein [Mycoplasma sp. CAG:877]